MKKPYKTFRAWLALTFILSASVGILVGRGENCSGFLGRGVLRHERCWLRRCLPVCEILIK